MDEFEAVQLIDGRRAVVRNGYLPAREILTSVGTVEVEVPKVRDRSGAGVKFNSAIVPPYVRRSARMSAALPWLYLKGISSGDLGEALEVLVGEDAKGLSPAALSRLKAQWWQLVATGTSILCWTPALSRPRLPRMSPTKDFQP